jgi:tetratricopeptide (TPR) repeat protein/DNA-binding winged helix-turn-helix (wHTH) protein
MCSVETKARVVRFQAFSLDLDAGELRKGDHVIKLHPQPAQLLIMLASRPGEIVSREKIQQALWEDDTHVDFDLGINSCIRQIRTALDDDAEKARFVETVPKKGYRFVTPVQTVSPLREGVTRRAWMYGTAALAFFILGALLYSLRPPSDVPPSVTSRPSIAVLPFDNVSGDPELDWLRDGLLEMMVTDLSQSPSLEVLSPQHLYQILGDLNQLDARIISLDVIQEIAERGRSNLVILGGFIKSGETVRINIRVQNASDGKILTSEKVEGTGLPSIFPLVDDLNRRIKTKLNISSVAHDVELDRELVQVTTSSIEAYQYYAEARSLYHRGRGWESDALYKKALELDPHFAAAFNGLSVLVNSRGQRREAIQYAERALENADRLSLRERYLFEARLDMLRGEATYGRSMESYRKLLDLYPEDRGALNNMGWVLRELGRYEEAIEYFEKLRLREDDFVGTYNMLAYCYACLGQFEQGNRVWQDYRRQWPEVPAGHALYGWLLAMRGEFDEALASCERADRLAPSPHEYFAQWVRAPVFIHREEWARAESVADWIVALDSPARRLDGLMFLVQVDLYDGRAQKALEQLERVASLYGHSDVSSALMHNYAAHVLLESGDPARAIEEAQVARREDEGNISEWEGLYLTALAQLKLKRWDEAQATAEELVKKTESIPTDKEKRRHHHLLGEIALAQGDYNTAVAELERAQSMLSPRGIRYRYRLPKHVPIWYSLAQAYLAVGEESKAAEWFERITESTTERLYWPIPYVRSFYFLGKIHEQQGNELEAREFYRRFYEYWKDGDLDRQRVAEAGRKMAGT